MAGSLRRIWEQLRGSLWFVPSLIVILAILLAFGMVALDRTVGKEVSLTVPLLFEAGPEGAREVLGTIAGSVLAVAGVAFSFTILAFSLASSQYSPRILNNFMDDRTNQTVLGVLLGSFLYCLLVLRTVRVEDNSLVESTFVPSLSVTVALLLALLDLGLFILYLHHIAVSVTAYHIIHRVGDAAVNTVERIFPQQHEQHCEGSDLSTVSERGASSELRAKAGGYLQEIDVESILKLAEQHNFRIDIRRRVGDFVTVGKLLAIVTQQELVTEDVQSGIISAFILGMQRTQERDALFGVLQLSDVAIKALSPGINDPTTAIMCLDQIERILSAAGSRNAPSEVHCDSSSTPRVIVPIADFRALADQALNSIRHYGAGDVAVAIRMLEVITGVSEQTPDERYQLVLRGHALAVVEAATRVIEVPTDRALLDERIAALSRASHIGAWNLPLLGAKTA